MSPINPTDQRALAVLPAASPLVPVDHESLHGDVARASLGAALGAMLAQVMAWPFGLSAAEFGLPLVLAVGAFAALGYRKRRKSGALLGAALGVIGGGLFALSAAFGFAAFGGALLGFAATPMLAKGESWKRKLAVALFAGATSTAGLFVAMKFILAGLFTDLLPPPLPAAVAGAAAGLFIGLSAAPWHLRRREDPVERALIEAAQIRDGELHEIVNRALEIHRVVKAEIAQRHVPRSQELGQRVGELLLRILQITERCRRIEADLQATPAAELETRIAGLEAKAAAATDSAARATYLAAAQSLEEQRNALQTIGRGRERVVARLHANLAFLEKVRFSLLHLRSADAERVGGEATPLIDTLEELSRELDATSSAVGEVYGGNLGALPDNIVPLAEPSRPLDLRDKNNPDE